jgi:uncharacterized LabA/DUF88 family protein
MANKTGFIPKKNTSDLVSNLANSIRDKRVSLYIDSANLYFASNIAKMKIDFIQMARWFRQNSKLTGLNFYTAFNPDDPKQLKFLEELEKEGYNIIKKPIKIFESNKKGNMDIELAVDALLQKDIYETLILLSGDGDFGYLVKALSSFSKETIIVGVGGFTSYELHKEASDYFFLNRVAKIWQKPRSKKSIKNRDSSKKETKNIKVGNPKKNKPIIKGKTSKEKTSGEVMIFF